jgi:uracil-DNA glycosylase
MSLQGNIHPTGPRNAKIAVVIDAPSAQDIWASRPLSNTSGDAFSQLLQQAGLLRTECYITSLMRYRPLKDEISRFATPVKAAATRFALTEREAGLYIHPKMREFRATLQQEMRLLAPTVIITLGPYSTWALTDIFGPTATWRGSQLQCTVLPETTVIPTYHPAELFRQFDQRGLAIRDLLRAHCVARQPHLYREPRYSFTIAPSLSQVLGYLEDCLAQLQAGQVKISCDIETIAYYVSCVGLALNVREAICIPFMSLEGPYWSEEEELLVHVKLREVLTHPNTCIIGQNFNYDNQHFATEFGYLANLSFDTLYAQQVLFPGTKKTLDTLSSLYCHWHRYWKDENKDYAKLPDDMSEYWAYNCKDCVTTFEIHLAQQELIIYYNKEKQLRDLHRMGAAALRSMLRGVRIDILLRSHVAEQLMRGIEQYTALITQFAGFPLNVSSTPQMQKFFYEDLNLPVQISRKTHGPTLDGDALRELSKIEPILKPFIEVIELRRQLGTFLKTYCMMRLGTDGRMRCTYNVAGTETFRFSSSTDAYGTGGNLQNLSTGDSDD